jgi:hypothetical protein
MLEDFVYTSICDIQQFQLAENNRGLIKGFYDFRVDQLVKSFEQNGINHRDYPISVWVDEADKEQVLEKVNDGQPFKAEILVTLFNFVYILYLRC